VFLGQPSTQLNAFSTHEVSPLDLTNEAAGCPALGVSRFSRSAKNQRMLQADSRETVRETVSGAVLLLVKDTSQIVGRTL